MSFLVEIALVCNCAGTMGLVADLTAGEIMEQAVHALQLSTFKNVVFMGMVTPFSPHHTLGPLSLVISFQPPFSCGCRHSEISSHALCIWCHNRCARCQTKHQKQQCGLMAFLNRDVDTRCDNRNDRSRQPDEVLCQGSKVLLLAVQMAFEPISVLQLHDLAAMWHPHAMLAIAASLKFTVTTGGASQ